LDDVIEKVGEDEQVSWNWMEEKMAELNEQIRNHPEEEEA